MRCRLGVGSAFHVTLPKVAPKELFREYLVNGIQEAIVKKATLSILILELKGFDSLWERLGAEAVGSLVRRLEEAVQRNLRRAGDVSVKDTGVILVLLPGADKAGALEVVERLRQAVEEVLSKEKLPAELTSLDWKAASFPEDGSTAEEFLEKTGLG